MTTYKPSHRLGPRPDRVDAAGTASRAGELIVAATRGTTDSQLAAEPVPSAENKYQMLVESLAGVVYALDKSGRIQYASHGMLDILGYHPDEAIGRRLTEYLHPDDVPMALQSMQDQVEIGKSAHVELRALTKSGETRWVHLSSRLMLDAGQGPIIQGVLTDVTPLRQAEEALGASEHLVHAVVDTAPALIHIYDLEEQRYAYWNKGISLLLGYSPAKVKALGSEFLVPLIHPEDLSVIAEHQQRLLAASNGEVLSVEYRMRNVHGEWRLLRGSDSIFERTPEGRPTKTIGVAIDVTERQRAEDALREAAEDLKRSNSELEQFAYVASHDLQEPLRMVASYTQLLAQRYEGQLDDKAQTYIHYAVDGATRMQRLITDLLTYSRVTTGGRAPKQTDSYLVLGEALRNLSAAIDVSRAIVTNGDLPMVRADAIQLLQVFQNLIANAIKFRGKDSPRVHVSAREEGHDWLFSVKDNGIGIDPQHADRLFVIFQRLHTREEYPGTGVGLAVCKRIVERHGGRIWFESEPGKGSIFYFTLPR